MKTKLISALALAAAVVSAPAFAAAPMASLDRSFVEYTGTALTAVFHQPVSNDSSAVFDTVRTLYAKTGRTLLPPLGFNNTFAILVRGEVVARRWSSRAR